MLCNGSPGHKLYQSLGSTLEFFTSPSILCNSLSLCFKSKHDEATDTDIHTSERSSAFVTA